jgi:hypothetical protein
MSGPDFIFLDWHAPSEGWATNYTIEIEATNATFDDIQVSIL